MTVTLAEYNTCNYHTLSSFGLPNFLVNRFCFTKQGNTIQIIIYLLAMGGFLGACPQGQPLEHTVVSTPDTSQAPPIYTTHLNG